MSKPIFLKIHKDGKLLNIQQLTQEHFAIGSHKEIEVPLQSEEGVMPWHASIEKRGENYFLSDLGSPNGTFLNGNKIVESMIQSGDQIQIATFNIEFFIGAPYKAQASTVDQKTKPVPEAKPSVLKSIKPKAPEPVKEAKAPEPVKEARAPEPVKEARAPEPVKEARAPEPVKEARAPEPVKEARAPEPVKEARAPEPVKEARAPTPPPVQKVELGPTEIKKVWKDLLPLRPSKKKTFAPSSAIKDLEKEIPLGRGDKVEILVAWEDRIVSIYHAKKNEIVSIGNHPKASIRIPNMTTQEVYNLVQASSVTQIHINSKMGGKIIRDRKSVDFKLAIEKGVMTKTNSGYGLSLGQNEIICVHLSPSIHIYIRYTSVKAKIPKGALFGFNETELIGLGLSACFMLILFFFFGVYYPTLMEEERLEEKKIHKVVVQLKPPRRVVRLIEKKSVHESKKKNIPIKKKKKTKVKKAPVIKKSGKKKGRLGAVASKPKPKPKAKVKTKKKVITSARSGGSPIKSKKPGSGAKSPRPDPNKVGLLGVFGKSGMQKQLDKVYSGAGELGGLADQASGYSGSTDTYVGDGIGTKFKDAGASGKGSNLIGISGIATKGKGGGTQGYGRGGGLGNRGSVDLSFGTSEVDVEGNLDKDAIFRIVQSHKAQLARCHSSVLQGNPSIQGRIKVQWTIDDGVVKNVSILSNDSGSERLARCVTARLRNWKFPGVVPPGGQGVVGYPFVFVGS